MNSYMNGPLGDAFGFGFLGGIFGGGFILFTLILVLWELVWKGLALWYAARNGEKVWFVALLLIHTLGILDIIYLFGFRKDRHQNPITLKSFKSSDSSSASM